MREYRAQQVLTATEVHVHDIGLELEARAHPRGQVWIESDDILKLIQHRHGLAFATRSYLLREFEKAVDRVVDVGRTRRCGKLERWRAVLIESDLRPQRQILEEVAGAVHGSLDRRREAVIQGVGELVGEALFCRRPQNVDVGDQDVLLADPVEHDGDQRGLAEPARQDDEYVRAAA